jgi:hypothetical protein
VNEYRERAHDELVVEQSVLMVKKDQRTAELRELGRNAAVFARGMRDEEADREDRVTGVNSYVFAAHAALREQWKEQDDED